jgi:hypothetical protein
MEKGRVKEGREVLPVDLTLSRSRSGELEGEPGHTVGVRNVEAVSARAGCEGRRRAEMMGEMMAKTRETHTVDFSSTVLPKNLPSVSYFSAR